MKPKLRIFSNLARTGGTLVSRCVGCMDNIALLSEIHPLGVQAANINILEQAVKWYGLFQAGEISPVKRYTFSEITMLISRAMETKGLQLVIRDWTHLDFMAVPFIDKPYYRSRLVEHLQKDFDIIQYHLVRHPVPQWFSTNNLAVMHGKLMLEQYLEGYYRYACLASENGYVRYEDFTRDPALSMRKICANLEIDYDAGFIDKWQGYSKITGDIISNEDRRPKYSFFKPAELPVIDAMLYEQLHNCEYYNKSLELLGYDDVRVK